MLTRTERVEIVSFLESIAVALMASESIALAKSRYVSIWTSFTTMAITSITYVTTLIESSCGRSILSTELFANSTPMQSTKIATKSAVICSYLA